MNNMPCHAIQQQKTRQLTNQQQNYRLVHRSSSVQYRTILSHPTISPSRNRAATSTFSGESGCGCIRSWWIAVIVVESVYTGLQCSDVNNVRQISPVVNEIFGCEIRVLKWMFGGASG